MTGPRARPTPRWAGWCLVLGGAAMAGLWLLFTASHGPTSFNENRLILGRDMHFWGMLLGSVPNVLVAAGLLGLRGPLLADAGRVAVAGYVITIAALLGSAAIDFFSGSLGPPLLTPLLGVGLLLLGLGPRMRGARGRSGIHLVLVAIGAILLAAFAFAWIPLEVSDRIGGYRIYGAATHLAIGIGWIVAGRLAIRDAAKPVLVA